VAIRVRWSARGGSGVPVSALLASVFSKGSAFKVLQSEVSAGDLADTSAAGRLNSSVGDHFSRLRQPIQQRSDLNECLLLPIPKNTLISSPPPCRETSGGSSDGVDQVGSEVHAAPLAGLEIPGVGDEVTASQVMAHAAASVARSYRGLDPNDIAYEGER